jgi:hypothetical protein
VNVWDKFAFRYDIGIGFQSDPEVERHAIERPNGPVQLGAEALELP